MRDGSGPIQFAVDGTLVEMGTGVTHLLIVPSDGGLENHVTWSINSVE